MLLYPENYVPKEEPVIDRTPTEEQVEALKAFVKDKVKTEPIDSNDLLAPIEAEFPCVFTDSEKVQIMEELNKPIIAKMYATPAVEN